MRKQRLLIIGASGQLGSALLHLFSSSLLHLTQGTTTHQNHPSLYHLDITKKEDVAKLLTDLKPDVVINTAALTHVDKCEDHPEMAHNVNVLGNLYIFNTCQNISAKLIYISTYYVFDGINGFYHEEDFPHPLNHYAQTKLAAEQTTLQNKNNLVIRPSKIYSYGIDEHNFLARSISSLKKGIAIPVTNDQYTNPISAPDLAGVIQKLVEKNANGIYHAGGPDNISNYDFASACASIFSLPHNLIQAQTTSQFNARARRPMRCALYIEKITKTTSFKPNSIHENLKNWKKQEAGIT